ncbi:MAG: DNA polymerase III subunit gamma/tau [Clostridia bacterium]|nr:DNA polymerase III subunit gamma/tau [Clostridia bacterium]
MSYLAIYRRFRPKTFEEMIGQEHVVKTLINQVSSGRIGHAYLFCGTRGTGKTTAAKIFAKAINCEHPVNGSPCGKCPTCLALNDPANLDVIEMDAASNNKVENVREIRDKIQYPPVAGKYKVYIIDEVHMLTTEAFNALLKTLEEPPSHAVFILATTEQHKLPATILSRCMRFDFKLVPDKQIVSLIERIYDEVGKEYEEQAVVKIARSGEGCVRDALSIADLCLSFSDKKLTYNDVISVLGASDNQKTYELVEGIFTSDVKKALSVTEEACSSGKSVALICKDVLSLLRDALIVKTCPTYESVLAMPKSELDVIKALSEKADEHAMLRVLEIFSSMEGELRYSTQQRVVFETAVLKATMPQEDYNVDALIRRVTQLEAQLKTLTEQGLKVPVYVDKQPETTDEEPVKSTKPEQTADGYDVNNQTAEPTVKIEPTPVVGEPSKTKPKAPEQAEIRVEQKPVEKPTAEAKPELNGKRIWGTVIRQLRANNSLMLWTACQDADVKVAGDKLIVYVDGENEVTLFNKNDNLKTLQNIVSGICPLKVEIAVRGQVVDELAADLERIKRDFTNVTIEK